MKKLSPACVAVVLSLLLSASAFAGDIYIPAPAPPPPEACTVTAPSETANAPLGGAVAQSNAVSDIAMGLLQSLLSVF
jgi:hypothetical protein